MLAKDLKVSEDRTWAEHFAGSIRVYVDEDKTFAQRRVEFGLKRALAVLEARYRLLQH